MCQYDTCECHLACAPQPPGVCNAINMKLEVAVHYSFSPMFIKWPLFLSAVITLYSRFSLCAVFYRSNGWKRLNLEESKSDGASIIFVAIITCGLKPSTVTVSVVVTSLSSFDYISQSDTSTVVAY